MTLYFDVLRPSRGLIRMNEKMGSPPKVYLHSNNSLPYHPELDSSQEPREGLSPLQIP